MCNITGYSYGKVAWEGVILTMEQSGQAVPITLTIPVSGYYIPGVGFVPTSTFILLAVVIIIIIILIVILLIEYTFWRRRRLAEFRGYKF
jgi:predicted signal transduction protein with EAL and GGDEF domain